MNLYDFKQGLSENTILSDIQYFNIEDIQLLDSFRVIYEIDLPIVYLMSAHVEFMAYRLDCPSCGVSKDYFIEFYTFIENQQDEE